MSTFCGQALDTSGTIYDGIFYENIFQKSIFGLISYSLTFVDHSKEVSGIRGGGIIFLGKEAGGGGSSVFGPRKQRSGGGSKNDRLPIPGFSKIVHLNTTKSIKMAIFR